MFSDIILGKLPNPFLFDDGSLVTSVEDWRVRRAEIMTTLVDLEYGGMPPEPEFVRLEPTFTCFSGGYGGLNTYRVHAGTRDRYASFYLRLFVPEAQGHPRFPVVLTGDGGFHYINDAVIAEINRRGMIAAIFDRTEIAPDFMYHCQRDTGIYLVYPSMKYGAIAAWAWSYQRCLDALMQCQYVEPTAVAITGHSRGGKTVLLAGAMDERFPIVNPNNSGCCGAGCFRYQMFRDYSGFGSEGRTDLLSDTVRMFEYWLGPDIKRYVGRERELPFDQHFLKASMAPRWLLQSEGLDDTWANPLGTYHTHLAAREVYQFLGAGNRIATRYRPGGHAHGLDDFTAFLDFIEHALYDKPLPKAFNENPYPGVEPIYDWRAPEGGATESRSMS